MASNNGTVDPRQLERSPSKFGPKPLFCLPVENELGTEIHASQDDIWSLNQSRSHQEGNRNEFRRKTSDNLIPLPCMGEDSEACHCHICFDKSLRNDLRDLNDGRTLSGDWYNTTHSSLGKSPFQPYGSQAATSDLILPSTEVSTGLESEPCNNVFNQNESYHYSSIFPAQFPQPVEDVNMADIDFQDQGTYHEYPYSIDPHNSLDFSFQSNQQETSQVIPSQTSFPATLPIAKSPEDVNAIWRVRENSPLPDIIADLMYKAIKADPTYSSEEFRKTIDSIKNLFDQEKHYGKTVLRDPHRKLSKFADSDLQPAPSQWEQQLDSGNAVLGSLHQSQISIPQVSVPRPGLGVSVGSRTHRQHRSHGANPGVHQFHCTYPDCTQRSPRNHEWKRHETVCWQARFYICIECDNTETNQFGTISCNYCSRTLDSIEIARVHVLGCNLAKDEVQKYSRPDKLIAHLKTHHQIQKTMKGVGTWFYDDDRSQWPRECGFCGQSLIHWEARLNHVGEHFAQGCNIKDWKIPFPRPKDTKRGGSSLKSNDDEDSDDDSDYDDHRGHRASQSLLKQAAKRSSTTPIVFGNHQQLETPRGHTHVEGFARDNPNLQNMIGITEGCGLSSASSIKTMELFTSSRTLPRRQINIQEQVNNNQPTPLQRFLNYQNPSEIFACGLTPIPGTRTHHFQLAGYQKSSQVHLSSLARQRNSIASSMSDHESDSSTFASHNETISSKCYQAVNGGRSIQSPHISSSVHDSTSSFVSSLSSVNSAPPWHQMQPEYSSGDLNYDLPCEFSFAGCERRFQAWEHEAWMSHSLAHFTCFLPPEIGTCIFCDTTFTDMANPRQNWLRRMIHIGRHYSDGVQQNQSRPDFHLVDHMARNGLLSVEDYNDVVDYTERPQLGFDKLLPLSHTRNKSEQGVIHDLDREDRQRRRRKVKTAKTETTAHSAYYIQAESGVAMDNQSCRGSTIRMCSRTETLDNPPYYAKQDDCQHKEKQKESPENQHSSTSKVEFSTTESARDPQLSKYEDLIHTPPVSWRCNSPGTNSSQHGSAFTSESNHPKTVPIHGSHHFIESDICSHPTYKLSQGQPPTYSSSMAGLDTFLRNPFENKWESSEPIRTIFRVPDADNETKQIEQINKDWGSVINHRKGYFDGDEPHSSQAKVSDFAKTALPPYARWRQYCRR